MQHIQLSQKACSGALALEVEILGSYMHGWKGLKVAPTQVWTRGTFKCHRRMRVSTKTSVHVGQH